MENKGKICNSEQASLKAIAFVAKVFAALALMSLTIMIITIYMLKDTILWAVVGALPMLFLGTMCVSEAVYNAKLYKKKSMEIRK